MLKSMDYEVLIVLVCAGGLAQIVIKATYFPWRILPMSYVWAVVITFGFAIIVAFFLKIRLEKVNMAESMKAIE